MQEIHSSEKLTCGSIDESKCTTGYNVLIATNKLKSSQYLNVNQSTFTVGVID